MTAQEVRDRFLNFFKARGHTIVPSSSLIPDDPSVLLTTAGMQQFKPYFTGVADPIKDFGSKNTASIQKSFRTSDIDSVGDESHLTFFEMLGNFSFGGYFKKEAIEWAYEFITKEMGLKIDYVSVFGGEDNIPKDEESEKIWKSIDPNIKIKFAGMADNFWGPTGEEGPCGPTTEIYVNGLEIWNIVFNEFYCEKGGKLRPLETPGIDTGMGLERLAMVVQGKKNIFETDLFEPLMQQISKGSGSKDVQKMRIVADHIRAATFMVSDGIKPSNTDRGYVLRRLLRRARYYYDSIGGRDKALGFLADRAARIYEKTNYGLIDKIKSIDSVISDEETTFSAHLGFGERLLKKIVEKEGRISGENAFLLYSTYGFPFELILDIAKKNQVEIDEGGFQKRKEAHKEISKAGQEKKFGGHGLILDTGEIKAGDEEELKKVIRLHTATHLLQAALRRVLGPEVRQMGSDITSERARFDFSFGRKVSSESIKKVEDLVNEMINADFDVKMKEMDYEEAVRSGALSFFRQKYPKRVKVYTIGRGNEEVSKELCGGPHVLHTSEIGQFKIIKEEAVAAGIRRIRAVIDN